MKSLDDEKAALLAAKRQFLPLQSRDDKQKNILERVSKEINRNRRNVRKSCNNGSILIRNWKQPTLNRHEPNKRWRCWWLNSLQKMKKTVNQGNPGFQSRVSGSISDQVAQHTVLSRCKARSATVFRNSSWRLARLGRMSRKSARSWHRQCGHWKQGSRPLNLVPRRIASRAKWFSRMKSSPMENAYLDSAKWTPKDEKPSRGACQTPSQKRSDWRRNASKKEKVCSLLRLWIWIQLIAVPFYLSLSRKW